MSETNPYSFRTAVGGFHKGDVSTYIAKTASAHQAQLAELEQEAERLRAENQSLKEQLRQAEQAAQPVHAAPPTSDKPAAPEKPASALEEQELRAYRRAEAAERLACQRAKKLYQDMQEICDDSAKQMQSADAVTRKAMDAIHQQLQIICNALDSAHGCVRTSADSLKAMGALIPDPAEGLEVDL